MIAQFKVHLTGKWANSSTCAFLHCSCRPRETRGLVDFGHPYLRNDCRLSSLPWRRSFGDLPKDPQWQICLPQVFWQVRGEQCNTNRLYAVVLFCSPPRNIQYSIHVTYSVSSLTLLSSACCWAVACTGMQSSLCGSCSRLTSASGGETLRMACEILKNANGFQLSPSTIYEPSESLQNLNL